VLKQNLDERATTLDRNAGEVNLVITRRAEAEILNRQKKYGLVIQQPPPRPSEVSVNDDEGNHASEETSENVVEESSSLPLMDAISEGDLKDAVQERVADLIPFITELCRRSYLTQVAPPPVMDPPHVHDAAEVCAEIGARAEIGEARTCILRMDPLRDVEDTCVVIGPADDEVFDFVATEVLMKVAQVTMYDPRIWTDEAGHRITKTNAVRMVRPAQSSNKEPH
jgi:hypothetical protein